MKKVWLFVCLSICCFSCNVLAPDMWLLSILTGYFLELKSRHKFYVFQTRVNSAAKIFLPKITTLWPKITTGT